MKTKLLFLALSLTFVAFSQAQTKQTGTLIGTDSSWGDNPDNYKASAVDGDVNTFFDAPASAAWIGYDFETFAVLLTSIKFYPRSTHATRMAGNTVYGSNTGYEGTSGTLLYTFPAAGTGVGEYDYEGVVSAGVDLAEIILSPVLTESYQYIYMMSSNGCNVAELEFYGTTSTLGIDDINVKGNQFKLYPNPSTNNSFNISVGNSVKNVTQVKVYSMLGNVVLEKEIKANSGTITINHNLNTGLYIVNFDGKSAKLIVE